MYTTYGEGTKYILDRQTQVIKNYRQYWKALGNVENQKGKGVFFLNK